MSFCRDTRFCGSKVCGTCKMGSLKDVQHPSEPFHSSGRVLPIIPTLGQALPTPVACRPLGPNARGRGSRGQAGGWCLRAVCCGNGRMVFAVQIHALLTLVLCPGSETPGILAASIPHAHRCATYWLKRRTAECKDRNGDETPFRRLLPRAAQH